MTNKPIKLRWPRWIEDIDRLLSIRSHFTIAGNIRDVYLVPDPTQALLLAFLPALWAFLQQKGFEAILVYDRIDGFRVHADSDAAIQKAAQLFNLKLQNGAMPANLETLVEVTKRVVGTKVGRYAVVVDFASRISVAAQTPEEAEHRFFSAMEKLSLVASPVMPQPTGAGAKPLYNAVFWLLNRAHDIPSWFSLDSERISSLVISLPDYDSRQHCAQVLRSQFKGAKEASESEVQSFVRKFADGTDGMSLQAMVDIAQLARTQDIPMKDVDDAVRCFKVGATENPWRQDSLREKIRDAEEHIEARVKGQHQAVVKTIDILRRSVMGLTGAQARSRGGRPRGVLFFAGPTGVGKTELAKSLTHLLFGDEQAYIRFDMSEFSEEHSSARLLGAPPGYVGYEAGGELTNAVRNRPFSVVLFDEIEKCHPRLLDKFLQILEDGRLTDGRGNTVYFSEAVLIFTSNLGIFVEDEAGKRVQNVTPEDDYAAVERKVKEAISDYFKFRLGRPELLNRIGDNVVVFNFISSEVAGQIFGGMLSNIASRMEQEHKVKLELAPDVREKVRQLCTQDLSHGGRGIGNKLESVLINPLGRALFELREINPGSKLTVSRLDAKDQVYSVVLA